VQAMERTPHWCIVMPAYNEEDNIDFVFQDIFAFFDKLGHPFHILVVNDGSTDATGTIIDAWRKRFEDRIQVVTHETNKGFGEALLSGYANATGDLAVVFPSDRQFRAEDLARCVPHLGENTVIVTCRAKRNDPLARRLASATYRSVMKVLFGLSLRDINWIKIFPVSLLREMTIESRGPMIDAEMLIKAKRAGADIVEIDVPHYPRVAGKAKGATPFAIAKTFRDLFSLWNRLRKG